MQQNPQNKLKVAKKHSKRTLRTLFNYHFRASEGGNKVVHVEQTNYAPAPQTAVCGKICGIRGLGGYHPPRSPQFSYDTQPH